MGVAVGTGMNKRAVVVGHDLGGDIFQRLKGSLVVGSEAVARNDLRG